MTTNNKISTLIDRQFPDFFLQDGPTFVQFVKAYYEWLEQNQNAIDATQNVLSYRDIDDTLDQYIAYFLDEVAPSIPKDIIGDKRLFVKYIINLYRGKGSEQSYILLFRMLYDEDITLYYPSEDILRVSDGRWVQESSIRLGDPFVGDPDNLEGQAIEGLTSGATATVDRIIRGLESGLIVREVFLTDIDGLFVDGETITNNKTGDDLITGTVVSFVGTLYDVDPITFKGQGHKLDDRVTITGAGGSGANATITQVSSNSAISFQINDGGSGYRVGEETVFVGGPGIGATFEITSIVNTEIIQFNTDRIEPVKNVVLDTSPYFVSAGANTQAVSNNFATANINSTLSSALAFSNVTVGTIGSITTINSGTGYDVLPVVSVRDLDIFYLRLDDGSGGYKGKNANVTAFHLPGAIEDLRVDEPGSSYTKNSLLTITNVTRAGTVAARGSPKITGVRDYDGKYVDTKGFISWNPKLQDNYYYQVFSYVINSKQSFDNYKRFVYDVLHPSGTKLFGNFIVDDVLNISNTYYTASNTIADYTWKFTLGTGNVAVTNSSANVVGTSTTFTTELQANSDIKISDGLYKVDTVSNNTFLTLKNVYEGVTNAATVFYIGNTA